MRKTRFFRSALTGLLAAAALAGASATGAQDRDPTPAERSAGERVDAAIKAKDYATARAILAGPDMAQFAPAHFMLSQLHSQGLGGAKDEAAARASLRRSAELGMVRSMMILGETLEREGQAAGRAEAKSWFTAAANLGLDHARAHLGRMLWEDGDKAGAFANWSRGAAGDSFARSCLGMVHAVGQGAPADRLMADYQFYRLAGTAPSEGAPCVEIAAQSGNAWAQYLVGLWLTDPQGKAYNAANGVKLLEAASEQGHARAAAQLAGILDKGEGVARDPARAFTHYLRAARADDRHYQRLAEMSLKGDGVPRSVADAVMYFEKVEYGPHQYQLGLIYAGAEGWPRDMTKAVEAMTRVFGDKEAPLAKAWLKQQADAGNALAQYEYASEIEYDRVETDASGKDLTYEQRQAAEGKIRDLAYSYYRKAAQQNLPKAMYALATKGTSLSDAEEVRLLRGAADAGYAPAMLEMARWHALGWHGLAKDEAAKRSWQDRAARTNDPRALAALGETYLMEAALGTNWMGSDPAKRQQVAQGYLTSARYYEAAHARGYEGAAGQLADIYDNTSLQGVGNPALELKWRKIAVQKQRQEDEMIALSKLYETGRGTPVDLYKAWFWARSAQRYGSSRPNERADALWSRLTPAQKAMGERALIGCEMSGYKDCSV